MAFARTVAHATSADGSFSAAGVAAWNGTSAHSPAVAGADVGGILYCPTATTETTSAGFTFDGTTLTLAMGTVTAAPGAISITQTRNAAGTTFNGIIKAVITDTASAAGSLAMQILGGASGTTGLFQITKGGNISSDGTSAYLCGTTSSNAPSAASTAVRGHHLASNAGLFWGNDTFAPSTNDATLSRAGTNNIIQAGNVNPGGGSVTSRAEINKAVTAFTDATPKTVFTLTIPNAAHSASYLVRVTGSIGAGGAIGANEASATNAYIVTICRTAGVNAVAGISAAFGASTAAVAGATTVTCTGALAAVSGGVGAVNTIDIQATITKGGGSSDNHTCVATASLLNANSTGVTIS